MPQKPVQPEIVDFSDSDDDTSDSQPEKPKTKRILTIVGFILAVAVAAALVWYLPKAIGSSSPDDDTVDTAATTLTERVDTVTPAQPVADEDTTPKVDTPVQTAAPEDEAADLAYLNNSGVWERSKLKSDKYRALYDAITEGNINAIASNEYFATPGRATNASAIKVVDAAWSSIGTGTQKANERELKKMQKAGRIDLAELYDNLARFRDKETNKTPRPGTK